MVKTMFAVVGWFCVSVMGTCGYGGIALLMAIESACIPLPSELIMPYAGALCHLDVSVRLSQQFGVSLSPFHLWFAAIAGALGCNIGSEIAYWVGACGGRRAIERYGRHLLISPHEFAFAERWFHQRGEQMVLFARLLPVVRTFIALPAGVVGMNRARFHLYTFVGSLPWCMGLAWAGRQLGVQLLHGNCLLTRILHKCDLAVGLGLLVCAFWFVRSRLRALRCPSGLCSVSSSSCPQDPQRAEPS